MGPLRPDSGAPIPEPDTDFFNTIAFEADIPRSWTRSRNLPLV